MKPTLYKDVALTRDVPEGGLCAGDVAKVIDYVPHPKGGEEGAILEIFNALGESIDVRTVPVSAIAELRPDQIFTVREITLPEDALT